MVVPNLASARILFVGLDPCWQLAIQRLVADGLGDLSFLSFAAILPNDVILRNQWLFEGDEESSRSDAKSIVLRLCAWAKAEFRESAVVVTGLTEDLNSFQSLVSQDLLRHDLVVLSCLPRGVELSLSELLWQHGRCVVSARSDEFHAKVRSQYGNHRVWNEIGQPCISGRKLAERPQPPSSTQIQRALSTHLPIPLGSSKLSAYALLVLCVAQVFTSKKGYPPAHRFDPVTLTGHEAEVRNQVSEMRKRAFGGRGSETLEVDVDDLERCLNGGFGDLALTPPIMASMLAYEVEALLCGDRPLNTVPLCLTANAVLGIRTIF